MISKEANLQKVQSKTTLFWMTVMTHETKWHKIINVQAPRPIFFITFTPFPPEFFFDYLFPSIPPICQVFFPHWLRGTPCFPQLGTKLLELDLPVCARLPAMQAISDCE